MGDQGGGVLGFADEHDRPVDHGKRSPMSDMVLEPNGGSNGDASTDVPEPVRVEPWLRRLTGFEDTRVVAVVPLTDGLSNVTCRLELTDAPVAAAVLRIQPGRGIFEPYNILREGEVLNHLAGTAVPVPTVLASESDPRFFGAPFLLLESIDAPHMPAPETDFATFTADLPAFAAAVAAIHAVDWRTAGLDFLGVPSSAAEGFKGEVEAVAQRMSAFGCADEPLLNRALTALLASTPSGGRLALCHGDPNPFNYLFRGQQVVGIVDWEQALISDPRSDIGQLVALSHFKGAAPYGPPSENPFVQLYEASIGETLESMELFRARWLFQLGVVYYGWKAYGTEPWFSWEQVEDLLTQSLAEL
jgi:aminoglycoside phosphotransferase (APT) family kinase protein